MTAEALLENLEVRARIARFTVEQYHLLGEASAIGRRTELIRGYVFDKMSKSPLYSSIGTHIDDLLFPQIPAGWWIRKEEPLTFQDSEPEPDVSIGRGSRADFRACHPKTAALVIEVAVTTVAQDRALVSLYAEAAVEEYWIVRPRERRVEVYRRPAGEAFLETLVFTPEMRLESASIPGVRIDLVALFAS